jgi:hypothetical protein
MKRMAAEIVIALSILNVLWWLCNLELWVTGGNY